MTRISQTFVWVGPVRRRLFGRVKVVVSRISPQRVGKIQLLRRGDLYRLFVDPSSGSIGRAIFAIGSPAKNYDAAAQWFRLFYQFIKRG